MKKSESNNTAIAARDVKKTLLKNTILNAVGLLHANFTPKMMLLEAARPLFSVQNAQLHPSPARARENFHRIIKLVSGIYYSPHKILQHLVNTHTCEGSLGFK